MKKKLPTVFVCPRCGEEAVRVTIAKDTGHATVLCALCNLKDEFPAHPAAQAIDVYSYFTDRFYGVKDPRAIIPHDREIQHAPPEEEPIEETVSQPISDLESSPKEPEIKTETPEIEPPLLTTAEESRPEIPQGQAVEGAPVEPVPSTDQEAVRETQPETTEGPEKESDEAEPFADILENKDKKRYSSTPMPQQQSEQTS